ncbi:hypothetical protein [Tunturiibacter psychrotolerans]|uniref:hypothetical protein n=1 Tax=Tunturiibacter psychrotolerans TaxID=3069686 RepID=UPI003342CFCD
MASPRGRHAASTFSNNQTIGASSGGAIWSNGTLTVSNSIFSGNLGATNGGAILNSSGTNTATATAASSSTIRLQLRRRATLRASQVARFRIAAARSS